MMTILSDDFQTPLGTIRTWAEIDSHHDITQIEEFRFTTAGYEIYLQPFDLKIVWSPGAMEYDSGKGWRWFIRKSSNLQEQLIIFCKLINPSNDTEYGSNAGEHLDAIEIENKAHHLHIGTEDGEIMQYRVEVSDWMPARFKDQLGFHFSFTEYIDFGFKTTVPDLSEGETIYFHFITASDLIKPSKDYPAERDASTWFAVDQSKKYLDEKLASPASDAKSIFSC